MWPAWASYPSGQQQLLLDSCRAQPLLHLCLWLLLQHPQPLQSGPLLLQQLGQPVPAVLQVLPTSLMQQSCSS